MQARSIPKSIGKNILNGLQNGSKVEKDIFTIGLRKLISKNLNNKKNEKIIANKFVRTEEA
jgi:hypothetical protein